MYCFTSYSSIIETASVQTNLVVFEIQIGLSAVGFVEQMDVKSVGPTHFSKLKVRAVTRRMINSLDINEAPDRIGGFIKELTAGGVLSVNILAHEVPRFNAKKPSGQNILFFLDQLKSGSLI